MGKLFGLVFIVLLVVSCGSSRSDNTHEDSVSTLLFINVIGTEIYTEPERIDALIVIDLYWTIVRDCVIKATQDREDEILNINPEIITVNIRTPQISEETGQEYFKCFAGKCSALLEGRWIDTVPSLPALGHEFGHYWNKVLFGSTNHNVYDLSILCNTPRICHEYMINENLLGDT